MLRKAITVVAFIVNVISAIKVDMGNTSLAVWFEQLSAWKFLFYVSFIILLGIVLLDIWEYRKSTQKLMDQLEAYSKRST